MEIKKVILDCLGGDCSYASTLEGARLALKKNKNLELVLVGDEVLIKKELAGYLNRIEIIHSTVGIGMGETPTTAIRQKPDSSIVLGLDALKHRNDCGSFVSAGSTGAVLTGAFMRVGRIEGVSRPALCPTMNTINDKGVLVLDVGANMDCKPINLVHFAIMANSYAQTKGIKNARIGLLSIGAEDEKGNELTHEAFDMLKKLHESGKINFCGNVEAGQILSGNYDAIICDGFVGNVLLKSTEGALKFMSKKIKEVCRNPLAFGAIPGFYKMKKRIAFGDGGAIFLGIKKPVMKSHGNADPNTIRDALLFMDRLGGLDLTNEIAGKIAECSKILG